MKIVNVASAKVGNKRTLFEIVPFYLPMLGICALIIWLFIRRDNSFGWFALSCLLWLLFISALFKHRNIFPTVLAASQANLSFFVLYI